MDKRTKKSMQLLNEKLQNRPRQLASARKQPADEHTTIGWLQKESGELENELDPLHER